MFDYAESDAVARNAMLEAIRQSDVVVDGQKINGDAVVAKGLMKDLNEAVKEYYDNAEEVHARMRAPLQLDKVYVPKQTSVSALKRVCQAL
jgi:DeoR/GlpR family transcriptional regulator of sugar metabolism